MEIQRIVYRLLGQGHFLGLAAALVLNVRSLDAQVINPNPGSFPEYSTLLRTAYITLVPGPYREKVEQFRTLFLNPGTDPRVDGGGSGDGSSGDGSGDGTSDAGPGSSGDGTDPGTAATDAGTTATDSGMAATDPGNTGDPDPDPGVSDNSVAANESPTDPITAVLAVDFAAQQAFDAVVNPFGGDFPINLSSSVPGNTEVVVPGTPAEPGSPSGPDAPGPGPPGAPVGPNLPGGTGPLPPTAPGQDVAINAVIVSGAESPWDAISKVPGVRNITVTGGVIALGGTPQLNGTGTFFQVYPDRKLLNGSVIPPVVPNVIDIRIMNCPIEVSQDPRE
jgi:hypothetical protein